MLIWKVTIGRGTMATDNWLIRSRTFADATKKAVSTNKKKNKDFVSPRDILRLEVVGEEEV